MLFELFMVASERYGVLIEEPTWIELPSRSQAHVFEQYINDDVNNKIHKAVVVLLPKFT
jgi:hypothetical protein